ncbi:MAG: 30S ribosomal protein S2, partial [Pirellulaceae bacterium]|nr:30S ribosomal protein S2 [Pirellulaceae bacterium]
PEAIVVVDPNKEKNAVREARSLGITTVALIDTDCDPDTVDLPIPGNDDGIRSIEVIIRHLADSVIAGGKNLKANKEKADADAVAEVVAATVPDKDAGSAEAKG